VEGLRNNAKSLKYDIPSPSQDLETVAPEKEVGMCDSIVRFDCKIIEKDIKKLNFCKQTVHIEVRCV
jgi:hypothetical protein